MIRTALFSLTFAAATAAAALAAAGHSRAILNAGDFTVETENLQWNKNSGVFTVPAHVRFTQPGTDVAGDRAQGNSLNKQVTVTGNVVLHNAKPVAALGASAATNSSEPQTLLTDELQIDARSKIYLANGRVRFTQGGSVVTADHGLLNTPSHMLDLTGNVHIRTADGQQVDAISVHYDTLDGSVNMSGKPLNLRAPAQGEGPLPSGLNAGGKAPPNAGGKAPPNAKPASPKPKKV